MDVQWGGAGEAEPLRWSPSKSTANVGRLCLTCSLHIPKWKYLKVEIHLFLKSGNPFFPQNLECWSGGVYLCPATKPTHNLFSHTGECAQSKLPLGPLPQERAHTNWFQEDQASQPSCIVSCQVYVCFTLPGNQARGRSRVTGQK